MNASTRGIVKKGLPEGFLYVDEVIEDCIVDAKYFGTDNFMGRRAEGYNAPLVVIPAEMAQPLQKAAEIFRQKGMIMKFYDAYRPQRAVDDFVAWGAVKEDDRRKPVHYPHVEKAQMFELGYIDSRSGHSRGRSVDLTLVDQSTMQELDMGSIFDFMDERSHHGAPGLTPLQESNRKLLLDTMLKCGFGFYQCEWWHYNLVPEPHPDTYYDFPVE